MASKKISISKERKRSFIFLLFIFIFSINACSQRKNTENKATDNGKSTESVTEPAKEEKKKTIPPLIVKKDFLYDNHTLADTFPYKDTVRIFQWSKIYKGLRLLDSIQMEPAQWATIQNRRNIHGVPPQVKSYHINAYNRITDNFGNEQYQGIPLYIDSISPERYGLDGSLVKIIDTGAVRTKLQPIYIGGAWEVPTKYVFPINDTVVFNKAIFVDRTNQNIATVEKKDGVWLVRSMNPATTGSHHPPYQKETPLGIFVFTEKKTKMYYYVDGTTTIAGYAPNASRFCNGGYIHGVPVNKPRTEEIEFSATLGTTPRSHMCVRNATSHAKFVYDWGPVNGTIIFVFD